MEREALNHYLQQVPVELLQEAYQAIKQDAEIEFVGKSTVQTMLVPVHDPINGGVFFAGEVLVTSCIVQVNGVPGWAMVMDERPELAGLVATLDAAFAAGIRTGEIVSLAERGRTAMAERSGAMNRRTNGTRVSFDLL